MGEPMGEHPAMRGRSRDPCLAYPSHFRLPRNPEKAHTGFEPRALSAVHSKQRRHEIA